MVWSVGPTTSIPSASQPRLDFQQGVDRFDLEGDNAGSHARRVGITTHRRLGRQLEEGEDVAVAGIEEDVHVGSGFLRRRHLVLGNRQHEVHVQVLSVPLDGFWRPAAVGDVVALNSLDLHPVSRLVLRRPQTGDLHRLAQHADVADVVRQQEHQPGVDQRALRRAEIAMGFDQRFVEVVAGRKGGSRFAGLRLKLGVRIRDMAGSSKVVAGGAGQRLLDAAVIESCAPTGGDMLVGTDR